VEAAPVLAVAAADACLSGSAASTEPHDGTKRYHPSGRLTTDAAVMLVPNAGPANGEGAAVLL